MFLIYFYYRNNDFEKSGERRIPFSEDLEPSQLEKNKEIVIF